MADEAVSEVQAADGGFPHDYRRPTQLYCMNGGHHLQIQADGTVRGLREDGDAHGKPARISAHFCSPGQACGAFTAPLTPQVCRNQRRRVHFPSGAEGVPGSKMRVKVSAPEQTAW